MHPRERRHADIGRGALPLGECGFFGGETFFGRTVEAAFERELDAVAGVVALGDGVETREERRAVGYLGDADIDLGFGEVRDDVGRGGAAADVADVDHHVGHLGGNFRHLEEKLGESENGAAAVVGDFGGVRGAAVAGGDDTAGAFARMDDVAVGTAGFEDETKLVPARSRAEKIHGAVRTGFFVGREQYFPTDARGVGRGFEGLKRGEQRDEAALHIGGAGAVERGGVEPAARLKRVVGFVDGVEVAAEDDLRGRGRAQADAERARTGRIETGGVGCEFRDRGGGERLGEISAERFAHARETGGVAGAGVDIAPALEERAECGRAGGERGDGRRNGSHEAKTQSEARAVGQGHARGVGAVELTELGERIIGEPEKLETDETLLGAGRGGFFAGAGDKFRDGFFAHGGFGGVNQMNRAVGPMRDEAGVADPSVAAVDLGVGVTAGRDRGADDVNEITIAQVRQRGVEGVERDVGVAEQLYGDGRFETVAAEEKFGAIDFFFVRDGFGAGEFGREIAHEPAVGMIPIEFRIMISGGDAEVAVAVADALEETDKAGPVARERHGVDVLGEDEAVALAEAIDRLRVVGLKRHLAEQINLVGLADVFAREVDDAAAQIGFGGLEVREVAAGLGLGELIEWLGEKRRDRIGRSSGSRGFSGGEQAARSEGAGEEKAERTERHEREGK